MEKILLINTSPRAPKSNSKRYGELFSACCPISTETFLLSKNNHLKLIDEIEEASQLLLIVPLYADAIPVTLLNFLKTLEAHPPKTKPTISVLINCGFWEYEQNDTAVSMIELFAKQNDYPFGSVLKIGSGEAILNSPFAFLVKRSIKKFARAMAVKRHQTLHTTMPLPKSVFVRASTSYWIEYGKKYGTTPEEMRTMEIESVN